MLTVSKCKDLNLSHNKLMTSMSIRSAPIGTGTVTIMGKPPFIFPIEKLHKKMHADHDDITNEVDW